MKRIQIRKLSKKKRILIVVFLTVLILAGITAGIFLRGRAGMKKVQAMSVQSARAETGTVSTTVTGTGSLASGEETDVVVPAGVTVKEILVESGEQVKKGQKLATVDKASVAAELLEVRETLEETEDDIDALSDDADEEGTDEYLEAQVLYGKQEELKNAEEELEELLDTLVIKAKSAGIVSGIYVEEDGETSQGGTSSSSDSGSTVDAANVSVSSTKTASIVNTADGSNTSDGSGLLFLTADVSGQAETLADTTNTKIDSCSVVLAAPVTGEKPQTALTDTDTFTGKVSWNCSTETFQADTVYTATVTLTAKDGYEFAENIRPEVSGGDVYGETVETSEGKSVLRFKVKFAKTAAETSASREDATGSGSSGSSASGSGTLGSGTGNSGNSNGTDSGNSSKSQASQSGSSANTQSNSSGKSGGVSGGTAGGVSGGTAGSVSSGSSSASGSTSSSQQDTSEYSVYEAVAFTIASETETVVSINVDELDILSVKEGQTALVTLDALEDQEFEGTITKVSSTASENGSSVKYPVDITLEKTDEMMLGMSASATIQIDTAENAVLIPVSALQERGNSTFVYTEQDEDGNLTGEVEVETGLSDGSQVEITSGLSEGDTVYYLKTDSSDTDSQSGMPQGGGFPGGNMDGGGFGGGGMPSGDEKPSGGPGGRE